jgi:hypothetical protein
VGEEVLELVGLTARADDPVSTYSSGMQSAFNIQEPLMFDEHAEARRSEGNPNPWYGAAYAWQQPRHIRLSVQARF